MHTDCSVLVAGACERSRREKGALVVFDANGVLVNWMA